MARQVLLLRLEGVWQSWGTRSRWDVRDTGLEPTKSGIVGLLGCALGYPMGDPRLEAELDAGLRFGVRVESPGRVVQDYQTISDFLPTAEGSYKHSGVKTAASVARLRNSPDVTPATIISPRYYLEDAAFLVALEEKPGHEGLLLKCAKALQRPRWPVYLGRKACVASRPMFEELTEQYGGIEEALREHPWSWLGSGGSIRSGKHIPSELTIYIENETGPLVRQDAVRINQTRQYAFLRLSEERIPKPRAVQ